MSYWRAWKCPVCGHNIQWSYDELADAGNPYCPECKDDGIEMELMPERGPSRHEVHLIVPARSKAELEDVKGALAKDGHILCVALGRKGDNYRVVVDPQRRTVRLVIEMFGGNIERAWQDNPDVEISDVVFTEDPKYAETADRSLIVAGPLDGQFIYAHYGPPDTAGPELFGPIMQAAQARIAAARAAAERKEP